MIQITEAPMPDRAKDSIKEERPSVATTSGRTSSEISLKESGRSATGPC